MQLYVGLFVLLMTFVVGLGLLARRLAVPYPILFVIGGLLISFIPRLPSFTLDPNLVFFLFLPPLLYIQAFYTSWRDFRRELRAISFLAIGMVLVTTVSVAFVAHALIPGFPLAAGFVLGAIVSPPDAVAASAIAQHLGLPRRVVTVLEGESLVNDATGLVAFKISLAAVGATLVPLDSVGSFLYVAAAGIGIGLGIGWAIARIRRLLIDEDANVTLAVSLLTPFLSYLAADGARASGVLAVVVTGLYLGWESPHVLRPAARLQAIAFWEVITYLLNGLVFILIGLQLPNIVRAIHGESWTGLLLYAALVNATCILVRLFWVFPGAYLPYWLSRRVRSSEPRPEWREVAIVGWSGMRGVVSLAAALTLAGRPGFAQANLVQFLAFSVILTTLVFQGLTLPSLIRFLRVGKDGHAGREERATRLHLAASAREALAGARREDKHPVAVIDSVENFYRERDLALEDELADQLGWSDRRHHAVALRQLRRHVVAVQRRALLALRNQGKIGDDVMHRIEHELDLEEARLKIQGGVS